MLCPYDQQKHYRLLSIYRISTSVEALIGSNNKSQSLSNYCGFAKLCRIKFAFKSIDYKPFLQIEERYLRRIKAKPMLTFDDIC